MQETQEKWVQSPGREDTLEEEMATHSSILACINPLVREAWWATVHGVAQESDMTKQLSTYFQVEWLISGRSQPPGCRKEGGPNQWLGTRAPGGTGNRVQPLKEEG